MKLNDLSQCWADQLPIWQFDRGFLVMSDGSLAAGFRLTGKDITFSVASDRSLFCRQLTELLLSLPEGTRLQVFHRLSANTEAEIVRHGEVSNRQAGVYSSVGESRLKFLNENFKNDFYFKPEIFLFVRSRPLNYQTRGLLRSNRVFSQVSQMQYDNHIQKFERTLNQVERSLESADLSPKRLTDSGWQELLYEYFNLGRSEVVEAPKLRTSNPYLDPSLVDLVCLTDGAVRWNHLQIGKWKLRVISLQVLPETTFSGMAKQFTDLPFHFWLSQSISIPNQETMLAKLKQRRRLAFSMAAGSKTLSDIESESKLGNTESLLTELVDGTEKLVQNSLSFIIWGESETELDTKSDEIVRMMGSVESAAATVETCANSRAWVNCLPGSCDGLRQHTLKSTNAAQLMAVYAPYAGGKKPVCLIPNRDRNLVSIDPFEPSLPNWNGLVIGSSGSGKSFALSQLVLMIAGQNPRPRIVWIDNGESSRASVEHLEGQFVDLSLDSGICINPFDLNPGELTPSPTKVRLILAIVEMICKENESRGVSKLAKAKMEMLIHKLYEEVNDRTPTLGDYRELLKKSPDIEMQRFSEILYSWTGHTAYGQLLDGLTNVKLERDLISFELRGLDAHPDLESVLILLLTEFIQRHAQLSDQQYLLIVDEAWRLLQSDSGAAFTIEAYRTFRKYHSGIWAISQNIKDFFFREDVAAAILQNTPTRIVLKQHGVDWGEFGKILSLNETELKIIQSLDQKKGEYSEMYFVQGPNKSILRLAPDPFSYRLSTTDPADRLKKEGNGS